MVYAGGACGVKGIQHFFAQPVLARSARRNFIHNPSACQGFSSRGGKKRTTVVNMKRLPYRTQYYYAPVVLLLLVPLLATLGERCQGALAPSNTIFVNHIVPPITSNVSVSVPISSDNHQVPSAVISSPSPSPPPSASSTSTSPHAVPIVSGIVPPQTAASSSATASENGIQELTKRLESTFELIRSDELDVVGVQKLYDSMEITTTAQSDVELLEKIAQKLTRKLDQTISVVEELHRYIQQTGSKYGAKYNTLINPCPYSELINPWEDEAPFDLQSFIQSTKLSNASLGRHFSPPGDTATPAMMGGGGGGGASGGFLDFSAFPPANADSNRPRIRITDQTIDDNNANLQQLFAEQGTLMDEHYVSYRQQFFLSSFDHASAYKCHYYPRDGRLKALYLSTVRNKHVLILLDIGSTITFDQLEVAKAISKFVLFLLNENDRISVVAVGQRVVTPEDYYDCRTKRFARATMDEKQRMGEFIDSLNRTSAATDHTAGFQYAFDAFAEIYRTHDDEVPVVFLYLGRAQLPPGSPIPKAVLQTIHEGQTRLPYPVIINSCLILLDEREVAHEKQFIADISTQNYARYNLSQVIYPAGKMVMISKHSFDAQRFIVALMEPFLGAGRFIEEHLRAHLPYYDPALHDTVVTLSYPAGVHGLVGVDLYLSDLAEHVAHYRQQDDSYAFLIDLQGNTIMHPSFPRPLAARGSFFVTNITRLEREHFTPAYRRMLADAEGNLRINHYGTNRTTVYYWKRVHFYIVCIVRTLDAAGGNPIAAGGSGRPQVQYLYPVAGGGRSTVEYNFIATSSITTRRLLSALVYHRIDIYPPQLQLPAIDLLQSTGDGSVCRLVKQLALADASTLYLSASSFQSPYAHIRNNRDGGAGEEDTVRTIQNIMAYLKDTYGKQLFANPGLQPDVRSDVLALLQVLYDYRLRHDQSGLSRYVVRRYAATVNGVLQVFPGGLLDSDLEPTKRPWFVKALAYPGRLVATQPYLDAGGAGYVISVAYAIFEGRVASAAKSGPTRANERAIAVVAMDFTQAFFYKLLLDSSTVCSVDNIKCFLMDDRGYLVAHPMLTDAPLRPGNTRRPVEHITHKESQVANDILNHKQLVTKKMCYSYVNRTIQRFYQFNMSLAETEIVTNLMYGEKTKYQITLIPGTNLFLGIVNSTNDGGAFCPCSTVGNSCLNCNRMEQTECECPCECPLDYGTTDGDGPAGGCSMQPKRAKSGGIFPVPLCSPLPEELISMSAINFETDYELKSCTNIHCEDFTTQSECLGLVGCEWCQVDVDGENPLTTPFCTAQLACFNGVFGAPTPYGDAAYNGNNMEAILPPAYSSLGPVAGAILALCIVVGFAMYCFRQNTDQSGASEQLYDDLVVDHCHGLPLSRFDLDDGSPSDDCDIGRTHAKQNLLLNGQANANYMVIPNVASPYQMSADYRRPNGGGGGGSSDHGYSTMTHHEESEHLCLSNVDRQGAPMAHSADHGGGAGGKRLSLSDSASISTSVSSPYSNHTGGPGSSFLSKPPMLAGDATKLIGPNVDRFIDVSGQSLLPSPTSVSRTGVFGATILPTGSLVPSSGHHILVPVTVHRNMEVS